MFGTARTAAILATLVGVAFTTACDDDDLTGPDDDRNFGFDENMEGWAAAGADLENPMVEWEVAHAPETGDDDEGSIRITVDNLNDAAKVWIVRGFEAEPGRTYEVEISFSLGTSDFGNVNHWTIIAGAHDAPPEIASDLDFRDNTGNGRTEDEGLVWLDKDYTSVVTAGADGMVWVAIGVWGTYEVARTYYIDDVEIELDQR